MDLADLSETFNHCTVLLYYAHPNFKKRAKMGYHTDVMYNHKGIYLEKQNGQKTNTLTVKVNIGDGRKLKWRRGILTFDPFTRRYKWAVDKKWRDNMDINSGTIVIVNSLDEVPTIDTIIGTMIQYQHGGVIVSGSNFSCALAFRNVKWFGEYNTKNQLKIEGGSVSNEAKHLYNNFDSVKFHEDIKKLYEHRFIDEYKTFPNIGDKSKK